MADIDPNEVRDAFVACLFEDGESQAGAVLAEGIMTDAAFHPGRLAEHSDVIDGWLDALPIEFHSVEAGGAGGWSFLNVCQDREGRLWTGLHLTCEELLLLGMARGRVVCVLPRRMWSSLPGGMPYYVINAAPSEVQG